MVGAPLVPVGLEEAEVEVPTVAGHLTGFNGIPGAGRHGERGHAGRRAQALLGARVDGIGAPRIDSDGDAAEGSDAIDQEECAGFVRELREGLDGSLRAGGRLGVDYADDLDVSGGPDGGFHTGEVGGRAPGGLDAGNLAARAFGHDGDAFAEVAADAHDHLVAGLDQVHHCGFHAARAGPGRGQRDPVGGTHHLAKHLVAVIHDAEELGVEVAEDGRGHCLEDARVGTAGARAHEDASWGVEGGSGGHGRIVAAAGASRSTYPLARVSTMTAGHRREFT